MRKSNECRIALTFARTRVNFDLEQAKGRTRIVKKIWTCGDTRWDKNKQRTQ